MNFEKIIKAFMLHDHIRGDVPRSVFLQRLVEANVKVEAKKLDIKMVLEK